MERVAAGPGLSLAYEVSGDPGAPPMVLLHGLGDGAVDWRPGFRLPAAPIAR